MLLGLSSRKGPSLAETIQEFYIKGKRVLMADSWQSEGLSTVNALPLRTFKQGFIEAMDNAGHIHFDITGFNKEKALAQGSIEFITNGNVTDFEYLSILNTQKWKNKTTFYEWIDGVLKEVTP